MDFDQIKPDLQAIVDRGLSYAKNNYSDFSHEIFVINTSSLDINIASGMVTAIQGGEVGVGVRSVINNKVGFASSSGISDSNVNFAIDNAVVLSKSTTEADDRWTKFVSTKETGKDGLIEDSVLEYTSEDAVGSANALFKEAKAFDEKIISVNGTVVQSYGGFAIGNTEGLSKASRYTVGVGQVQVTAKSGDKTKTGMDFKLGRGIPDLDAVGTTAAEKAVKLLASEPLGKTAEMKVVLDNIASGLLIRSGLGNSINGKSIVEGRSAWADKMGDQVGIKGLNITDDAQNPEDPNSMAIDSEGTARSKTKIIENGILKSFIFDNYYANVHGSENTGHANRGGLQSYESLPMIGPSTLSLNPGAKTQEELASEIGEGILVTGFLMGMHTANVISGDFSVVSPSSFKIENGEVTTPVESITIAGNLYKAFNQIIGIGNDNELTPFGKVPSLAFEGFSISG